MATDIDSLRAAAKRIALAAIAGVHAAYYEAGGIRDTAEKLREQVDSAAKHVFSIATYAVKQHPKDLSQATELYTAMCAHAEAAYKAEHEVENLREALPTWASFKSSVLRGMKLGLSPAEHKSERKFRAATMALIAQQPRSQTTDDTQATGPPHLQSESEIAEFMASTVVPETLRTLMAQVVFAVEVVKSNSITQAEEILRETWQRLGSLTDKRKLRAA